MNYSKRFMWVISFAIHSNVRCDHFIHLLCDEKQEGSDSVSNKTKFKNSKLYAR